MADRPGRGGPDDGPDFNWLYGGRGQPADDNPDATRAIPRQPRPDEEGTRVMSTQPREPSRPTPPPIAPPPRTAYPDDDSGGGSRFRRPRFWVKTVAVLLGLWLIYTIAVPFFAWSKGDPIEFAPEGDRPAHQPGTTYLMVGNDSRANLSKEEREKFNTGNPSTNLTDTIMLLHTGDGPNLLLSIPRDSLVDMPGFGTSKINSAYARGGPELLTKVIEGETGIRVDEYVEIGLGGVAGVVDAIGGIEVCPRKKMVDPLAGLRIKKGCQEVDGEVALAYSRSRHASNLGDLDRVRRQREVVAAIGSKVMSPWTVLNPVRWWNLNSSVPDFFGFGEGTGKIDAAKWALAMTRVDGDNGLTCTMPVTSPSAEVWDMERAGPMFEAIIEDRTDDVTKAQCTPHGVVEGS